MSRVFLPLQGADGIRPKAPSVNGWSSPGYKGVPEGTLIRPSDWIGLRCDGLVVIDADTPEAAKFWLDRTDPARDQGTYVRKTPRGFHFIYAMEKGSPTGPAVGVFPGIDIRAGIGSQIVFYAPGYRDIGSTWADVCGFRPEWLPEPKVSSADWACNEGWTEMPEGRGNVTMTAIAGALRRQGMAEKPIRTILGGINKLCMTEHPMGADAIMRIAQSVCRYAPNPDVSEIQCDE